MVWIFIFSNLPPSQGGRYTGFGSAPVVTANSSGRLTSSSPEMSITWQWASYQCIFNSKVILLSRVKGGGLSRTFIHLGNLFAHHISHSASEVNPQFKTSAWLVLSFLQPSGPKEQQQLIFPYNIISESHVKVTRIKEGSRLLNNFLVSTLEKVWRKV